MPETIVCPYCPLHCDDIIANGDGSFATDCELAGEAFRRAGQLASARLGDEAIETVDFAALADHLGLSRRPVVEVGWVSIEQAKRLYELKTRIALKLRSGHHTHSQTLERDGFDSATIADMTKHADVILAVGNFDATPRLLDRLTSSQAELHAIASLNATEIASLRAGESDSLPESILSSRYLAIVIGESAFETDCEVACAESLHRFVRHRNGQAIDDEGNCRRAVLVRFDPYQNLQSVFRWRGNEPVQESLLPGVSQRWNTEIRIGDSGAAPLPVKLQIGGLDPGLEFAQAYLPAASVGVHHRGTTIRGDGSVCLPLSESISNGLEDPIELLSHVLGVGVPLTG